MKSLKFKTNINCGGCVANVTPFLNQVPDICEWDVDTANSQKVLTVSTEKMSEAQVIELVQKAGYKAESL